MINLQSPLCKLDEPIPINRGFLFGEVLIASIVYPKPQATIECYKKKSISIVAGWIYSKAIRIKQSIDSMMPLKLIDVLGPVEHSLKDVGVDC